MTRERAKELAPIIAAYGEGKIVEGKCDDEEDSEYEVFDNPIWLNGIVYRIKPEPKRRLMTREEVLGFVAHHPHIVVRSPSVSDNTRIWVLPEFMPYLNAIEDYEWATITESGEIGEPRKFEIEEE